MKNSITFLRYRMRYVRDREKQFSGNISSTGNALYITLFEPLLKHYILYSPFFFSSFLYLFLNFCFFFFFYALTDLHRRKADDGNNTLNVERPQEEINEIGLHIGQVHTGHIVPNIKRGQHSPGIISGIFFHNLPAFRAKARFVRRRIF